MKIKVFINKIKYFSNINNNIKFKKYNLFIH